MGYGGGAVITISDEGREMSKEIDWSKAPEGARYARQYTGGVDFYKRDRYGKWVYFDLSGNWSIAFGTSEEDAIQRPDSWNGGNLPPVGTVCKISKDINHHEYYAHHAGREAHIIAHNKNSSGNESAVYWVLDDDGCKEYHALTADFGNFEPIRTAEQIAAEERRRAIYEMASYGIFGPSEFTVDFCNVLYDAGYRKCSE